MSKPKVYIDFEYNGTTEAYLNLVCCAVREDAEASWKNWWLDKDDGEKSDLRKYLLERRDSHEFVAFNVVAEASSFIALRLDPSKFTWRDLQLEYKMLLNHNHKYMYGKQLIKGKKRKTSAPVRKWEMTEEERLAADNSKPEKSLAACVYKMLGKEIDTVHKTEMRDLIISAPETWGDTARIAVLSYCESDVEVLPELHKALLAALQDTKAYRRGDITAADINWRGESAARTALIAQTGYPVSPKRVKNFSASVPAILKDLCDDINSQFPGLGLFEWNKKRQAHTMKQAPFRDFIKTTPHAEKWMKTDGGQASLALDAWTRHYSYSHTYPEKDLPAQVIRYLKTKQNLNGFLPKPKGDSTDRKTFFDYYGSDGRARTWLNPYGAQSSRFQPSATGFIPLKSAWMRSLIEPRPGFSIASIDYGSEEFLLAALLSKDKVMYEAYCSGDPYLHFAKQAGAVPTEGTKDSHPVERLRFKSTVLGIGYLMGHFSLASKLSDDTGVHHTPEDAEKLIQLYFEVFAHYGAWIDRTLNDYNVRGYLKLLDGWIMFGDNDNHRSISNCPVQGAGACVLRRAIKLSQEKGLRVIIPLHDALYIEYPTDQPEKVDQLAEAMLDAFSYYFRGDEEIFQWSKAIRLDIDVWGPGHIDGGFRTPGGRNVKCQRVYIDPRAKQEYERFSRYF